VAQDAPRTPGLPRIAWMQTMESRSALLSNPVVLPCSFAIFDKKLTFLAVRQHAALVKALSNLFFVYGDRIAY
jgi:hypothetical protein